MTYSVYEKAEGKGQYFRVGPLYKALRKTKRDHPECVRVLRCKFKKPFYANVNGGILFTQVTYGHTFAVLYCYLRYFRIL